MLDTGLKQVLRLNLFLVAGLLFLLLSGFLFLLFFDNSHECLDLGHLKHPGLGVRLHDTDLEVLASALDNF